MATPTTTLPAIYGSLVTVQAPDAQNAPPSFIELDSGKMLFFFSPGSSHTSTDGNLAMRTAASEAAALAGAFTDPVVLAAYNGVHYYGGGYAAQQKEGPDAGRVYLVYGSGLDIPGRTYNEWQAWVIYTDNPDDDVIVWSSPVEIPNQFDGGYSIDANIKGMGINHPLIEIPGTGGQEWVVAVLGFDSDQFYEYSKLLATTTGPLGTWGVRSIIHDGEGSTATRSPSEPIANIIYLADGSPRLMVTVDWWPSSCYSKTSADWGFNWLEGPADGVTIATNSIAPPAFCQYPDLSIVAMTRNLVDGEHTWLNRTRDFGASWPQHWLFDSNGRMRYGNMQVLHSLRVGVCYATETVVFPSTECGVYFAALTVAPPTGGAAPAIVSPSLGRSSPTTAELTAQLTVGGMHTFHRAEYGPDATYGQATDWDLKPPRPALPYTLIDSLPAAGPLHARHVAKNLLGVTNGADTQITAPNAGLILDADSEWTQDGLDLTVTLSVGSRATVTATVVSDRGGTLQFAGAHASRFAVSLDGLTWTSTLELAAGETAIYLSALPEPGDGVLTASIGVPR